MGIMSRFNYKKLFTPKIITHYIIPINIVIIIILSIAYKYYDNKHMNGKDTIEGVRNTTCCGGVEAGVHYQETDTRPPDYIRRCFRSRRDNGEVVYEWSGFPCSDKDSNDCCQNSDGSDLGECVPTTSGGYCETPDHTRNIFRRGDATSSGYIKRSNDKLLDINNTIDMEDYFYDRSEAQHNSGLSPDMLAFLERRDKNSKFIQSHIVDKHRGEIRQRTEAKLQASEDKKTIQIKDTILAVHLLFVVGFALLVRELMVKEIDGFYDMLQRRYMEFAGKTM
jgi:hypothetical protein